MSNSDFYASWNTVLQNIVNTCSEKGLKISTAESLTGGMISAAITHVSGSSAVIELGICSYSNRIKHEVLGVSNDTLDTYTEYSLQCVEEMAKGAMRISGSDLAVSTSGVAGPSGGTSENPVGTVYIAVCNGEKVISKRFDFADNPGKAEREQVRISTVSAALEMLWNIIDTIDTNEGENNG